MTQENEYLHLGIEIGGTDDDSTAFPDTSEQKDSTSPEAFEQNGAASEESALEDETISESDPLTTISGQIRELALSFESKLKYDAHKNKIIDDLHQALQDHRQGMLQKYLQRIFIDVIKIIDDMRKLAAHHNPAPDEPAEKLLKFILNTASDLEDLFAWEGITPYTCEGDRLDSARQRVVDKIETDDPERDRTIAARLRPGYEYEGKILRPEMVSIYIFPNNHMPDDRKI